MLHNPNLISMEMRQEIETKLNELYVTDSLRRLVGAIPLITEEEMETVNTLHIVKEKSGL